MMTLDQLKEGQSSQIADVNGFNTSLFRQCDTLGLSKGAVIKVLRRCRGQGPMQIKCSGTHYAIRANEAAHIHIHLV